MRRRACVGLLVLVSLGSAACSDDSDDAASELCVSGYSREESRAIEEELIVLAHGLADGGTEDVRAIADAVSDRYAEHGSPRSEEECPDLDWAEDYLQTIHYLVAYPEHVSPELLAGLRDAADPNQPGADGGVSGVYSFLLNDRLHEPDYPGLHELRAWLFERQVATNDLVERIAEDRREDEA